ncbi:unnamed protein product [Peronospora belbahrii]|uniref:Uncharacterized protein n=1 Tax=Peronospora belbahrii TaxID=622444 RepID=A0ABN8CVA9_9STRA|nr:unnamed protein product [Peronospora belbahrii]
MPQPVSSTPKRAPPPPIPTFAPEPCPETEPLSETAPEHEQTQGATHAEPPSKQQHKQRGLMRVIGGLFKRKCISKEDTSISSDSEASQRRTSYVSRWSHRQSLPDAPYEVVAMMEPATAPIQEIVTTSSSTHMDVPVSQRLKQEKVEKVKKETKFKQPFIKANPSPRNPSKVAVESSDESGAEPLHVSFLFFGGSDADSTFEPDLRPSEFDDLHENEIRPSLQTKMPVFLSLPLMKNMRRSCILPDPKEYEL